MKVQGNENANNCYLCGSDEYFRREGQVRDNPGIKIFECRSCGLVYLSSRDHIDMEHYEKSGMHEGQLPDIQHWLKETYSDDSRRFNFLKEKIINKKVLDFGCGIGGFIELAKVSAHNIAGIELEKFLQASFINRNLIVFPNTQTAKDIGEKWDVITAFHVIEHLNDPQSILFELSSMLEEDGEIIVEVPSSDDALLTLYECLAFKNFTYWSQHLFLFNASTFRQLIKKAGLKLNWIKHIQRYPLSNHLHWLAKGLPGGHQKWSFMNNQSLDKEYESQLAAIGKTDTIIASISL